MEHEDEGINGDPEFKSESAKHLCSPRVEAKSLAILMTVVLHCPLLNLHLTICFRRLLTDSLLLEVVAHSPQGRPATQISKVMPTHLESTTNRECPLVPTPTTRLLTMHLTSCKTGHWSRSANFLG